MKFSAKEQDSLATDEDGMFIPSHLNVSGQSRVEAAVVGWDLQYLGENLWRMV